MSLFFKNKINKKNINNTLNTFPKRRVCINDDVTINCNDII